VEEKAEVQNELLAKVPEAEPTSESGAVDNGENSSGIARIAAGAAAGGGASAAGAAYYLNQKTKETTGKEPASYLPSAVPSSIQDSINSMNARIGQGAGDSQTNGVPEVVTESQQAAHVSPEAAALPEVVAEKSAVEQELLKEVKPSEETGAPAPSSSAALATTAPAATNATSTSALSPNSLADDKPLFSSTENVADGLNAPGSSQAQTPATKQAELLSAGPVDSDSRDVSPMSKPIDPMTTTGVESTSIPAKSDTNTTPVTAPASTPQKAGRPKSGIFGSKSMTASNPSSPATGEKEKKKGFFAKLKERLK